MRKIEQQMIAAIAARKNWTGGSTSVKYLNGWSYISLHGNNIAQVSHDLGCSYANAETLRQWPTATTKSRLRALGVHVTTKNHVTYLEGKAI